MSKVRSTPISVAVATAVGGVAAFPVALVAVPAAAATLPDGYFPRTQTWECKKLGTFEVAHFSEDDSSNVVYLGDPTSVVAVIPVHGWVQFTFDGVAQERMKFSEPTVKPAGYKIDRCVVSASGVEDGVAVSIAGVALVVTPDRP